MGKNNWVGFGPVYKHAENPEVKPRLFKRNQARMNYQYHVENGLNIASQTDLRHNKSVGRTARSKTCFCFQRPTWKSVELF